MSMKDLFLGAVIGVLVYEATKWVIEQADEKKEGAGMQSAKDDDAGQNGKLEEPNPA